MSKNNIPLRLSAEAIQELRKITQEEYSDSMMSDDEIGEMGIRVLRLFKVLAVSDVTEGKDEAQVVVSTQEFKVLKYLHDAIYHKSKSPSIREISTAMGLRSSRSGFRLLKMLMKRGFVYRDENAKLKLAELVRRCNVRFTELAA